MHFLAWKKLLGRRDWCKLVKNVWSVLLKNFSGKHLEPNKGIKVLNNDKDPAGRINTCWDKLTQLCSFSKAQLLQRKRTKLKGLLILTRYVFGNEMSMLARWQWNWNEHGSILKWTLIGTRKRQSSRLKGKRKWNCEIKIK